MKKTRRHLEKTNSSSIEKSGSGNFASNASLKKVKHRRRQTLAIANSSGSNEGSRRSTLAEIQQQAFGYAHKPGKMRNIHKAVEDRKEINKKSPQKKLKPAEIAPVSLASVYGMQGNQILYDGKDTFKHEARMTKITHR